jgi:hypothetical protein
MTADPVDAFEDWTMKGYEMNDDLTRTDLEMISSAIAEKIYALTEDETRLRESHLPVRRTTQKINAFEDLLERVETKISAALEAEWEEKTERTNR